MGSLRKRGRYWHMRYRRLGVPYEESSHKESRDEARELLKIREGDIAKGKPVSPQQQRLTFADAAALVLKDYRHNKRRSARVCAYRLRVHLLPYFGDMRMVEITTSTCEDYIDVRTAEGVVHWRHRDLKKPPRRPVSIATINRELTLVKRAFTLSIRAGLLFQRPHIPIAAEHNVRKGFFEPDQFEAMRARLPEPLQPLVTFMYLTGWRSESEVMRLGWQHIDFLSREVRLDADMAKNEKGRVFPFTAELEEVLVAQRAWAEKVQRETSTIVPWVFFRMRANGRRGPKQPQPIKSFRKWWNRACREAGHPGKLPHDFRRTTVRHLERSSIPRSVAKQLTGHKTDAVYQRYDIVSDADLRVAAERLNANPMTSSHGQNVGKTSDEQQLQKRGTRNS